MSSSLTHMKWQYAALTDRGRLRRRNEDALLALPGRRLFAVADGMGGHAAGDVASALAVATLDAALPRAPSARLGAARLGARLRAAFQAAHEAILEQSSRQPEQAGMGTTLTALVPLRATPACVIAHLGDSRAYRLRDGRLAQLTHDHTWVQQQVDAGKLTAPQARSHPWASVLTRVLGGGEPGVADIVIAEVDPGDLFLLCTDGLTSVTVDAEIATLLSQSLPLPELAQQLVDAALLRGGPDNITVILLRADALVAARLRPHLRAHSDPGSS
ncbi:MAG TPA: PP2C family serine/threonine-protein phosphatase [Longimicrobiales bacterium]|nr:PP2C family serine/threonine-protein phosphatase [Longimicrobiales bacterium]